MHLELVAGAHVVRRGTATPRRRAARRRRARRGCPVPADAIEYERVGLVAVGRGQPHVEVLAGVVARPAVGTSSSMRAGGRRLACVGDGRDVPAGWHDCTRRRALTATCASLTSSALPATGRRGGGSRSAPRTRGRRRRHRHEPAHPLRALPEVEVRHEQPRRTAVLGVERLAVELERDPGLAVEQVLERHVGRVAAVACAP